MHNRLPIALFGLVLACVPGPAVPAHAQSASPDVRAQARAVMSRSQDAVVTAAVVVKMSMSMAGRGTQSEEIRMDVPATIVDPAGLAVVALSAIDPSGVLKQALPKLPGMTPELQSSLSEAKLRLSDQREIPVEVVLRDADLDLALLRPTEAQKEPLPAVVAFTDTAADVLDVVVVLGRMGRVANWAPSVVLDRVSVTVVKPRPYLVLTSQVAGPDPGQAVFTTAGALLGIVAVRSVPNDTSGGFLTMAAAMGGKGGNVMRVVVPAGDVRELVKQAMAAKP